MKYSSLIEFIDRLELAFQPGLNVLTGETGAGKSILLDSLGFVLGMRGRADLVRQGASQGEVTAWFDLPEGHAAHAVLEEAGLPGGGELILRRINGSDGRKTAWVNDRRCSGEVLRALSETLVELHGQHDDRGLLDPKGHRAILDEFAGTAPLRDKVRQAMRPGDMVLFLGAGDITQVAHQLAKDLHMRGTSHTTELRGLLSSESKVLDNKPLANRTTLGVGGAAEIYVEPSGETDLAVALRYAAVNELPIFILGRGSNLLIRDGGIRGVVVSLRHSGFSAIEVVDDQLWCGAGARLNHIANAARDAGLTGFEFMEGIPGCMGGALRMNAGAWGGTTFEQVVRVRYMTRDGQIEERTADH